MPTATPAAPRPQTLRAVARLAVILLATGLVSGAFAAVTPRVANAPRRFFSYHEIAKTLRQKAPGAGWGPTVDFMRTVPLLATASATDTPVAHSTTNVQVAGVDEGDIVKNDGQYIYTLHQDGVTVVKAYPDTALAVASRVAFAATVAPQELYVDGDRLVVIGTGWELETPALPPPAAGEPGTMLRLGWWWATRTYTHVLVYDIRDRANPTLTREIKIEGSYLSSRKIDLNVYVLTRSYPDFGIFAPNSTTNPKTPPAEQLVPTVADTARGGSWRPLPASQIYSFPGFTEPDYVVVASFNVGQPKQPVATTAYLGAGQTVYCSPRHLYVSATTNERLWIRPLPATAPGATTAARATSQTQVESTRLYKFTLANGAATLTASGSVPGSVLNSFSMDENGEFFRIATTFHAWWNPDGQDSNNLYVLDAKLGIVGRLEGLAPGERIYAARFVGDRCYLVTFRNIDPLFVIGLANPRKPEILGELKIPGYSNYLHPYDETHILGFGKEAVVVDAARAGDESWREGQAFYQGLKVALFDVSDVTHPVQLHAVRLGDRGTDSELLWNHKALLFDRDRQLLGFPVSRCEIPNPTPETPPWTYGNLVFEGAYVYHLTLEQGFELKGTITHAPPGEELLYAWNRMIRRLLFIGPSLYTVSDSRIKAHDLQTLAERADLPLRETPAATPLVPDAAP